MSQWLGTNTIYNAVLFCIIHPVDLLAGIGRLGENQENIARLPESHVFVLPCV